MKYFTQQDPIHHKIFKPFVILYLGSQSEPRVTHNLWTELAMVNLGSGFLGIISANSAADHSIQVPLSKFSDIWVTEFQECLQCPVSSCYWHLIALSSFLEQRNAKNCEKIMSQWVFQ